MPNTTRAAAKVDVVVTVADSQTDHMADVVTRLRAAGLTAAQSLPSAGLVTGRISPQKVAALRQLAGVQAVEASGEVQLAPPDADVQ
jgi:hypothetical protein